MGLILHTRFIEHVLSYCIFVFDHKLSKNNITFVVFVSSRLLRKMNLWPHHCLTHIFPSTKNIFEEQNSFTEILLFMWSANDGLLKNKKNKRYHYQKLNNPSFSTAHDSKSKLNLCFILPYPFVTIS